MRANHHSLQAKQAKQPNKRYKDLKQKQKAKIAEWMFQATCRFYQEHNDMPVAQDCESLIILIYAKIMSIAVWVPYEDVLQQYKDKLPAYETRIKEHGLPTESDEKPKSDDKKVAKTQKKGRTNQTCPSCGKRMVQQFIGLQHCKCGVSWKKDIGFFERTPDMVFALERRWVKKKRKQFPVIRFR